MVFHSSLLCTQSVLLLHIICLVLLRGTYIRDIMWEIAPSNGEVVHCIQTNSVL